jgi:hypothetical protein
MNRAGGDSPAAAAADAKSVAARSNSVASFWYRALSSVTSPSVLPSTARSIRSIARCTGSTLGNGRRVGKGTGAARSTTGVITGSGAANGAGGCWRTSGTLNTDTLPSTIRLATTASTATAANEMARRPAIPSCSRRGGLESGRAARRVNSSCRTAETKVPSLSCLLMTHILMVCSIQGGWNRVPCWWERSERPTLEL